MGREAGTQRNLGGFPNVQMRGKGGLERGRGGRQTADSGNYDEHTHMIKIHF